jgi:CTP synthase
MSKTKYIFVTGGVLSSLGKGITSASIATLLKHSGLNVSMLKIDPYLNVDPGTMSPLEHGEVYVTHDGAETDLDLGHYERFLDVTLSKENNFTTGQVYSSVIERERRGDYLGKTIQIIPHVTNEIKNRIKKAGKDKDILIVEIGGTVGDIESLPFLEAIRQLKSELGRENALFVHVTLIPFIKAAGELKTKPTQHSIQELRRIGITPNLLVCRSEKKLPKYLKNKISDACDVETNAVINAYDANSIYEVPLIFKEQNILTPIAKKFDIDIPKSDMSQWEEIVNKVIKPTQETSIAFVGKYLSLKESYKSLIEALTHCGAHLDTKLKINWIDSEKLEVQDEKAWKALENSNAILVAGGFGERGVNGKLEAIKFARVNKIPYLGICLGMQLALVEFSKNVLGLSDAHSVEFIKNPKNPIIYLIDEFIDNSGQKQIRTHTSPLGGTLRLGAYECNIEKNTKLHNAYKKSSVTERHRHRFEANPAYKEQYGKNGLVISGHSQGLIEAIELKEHPWFVGVQFHPEFTSTFQKPNPVIFEFVKQSLKA